MIEDIGLFATIMMTAVNVTRKGVVRGSISIGVAYGTNLAEAEAVLLAATKSSPFVLDEPGVDLALVGFGASSCDFAVMPWSTTGNYLSMLHDVRHRVYVALNEAGIDIPFDQVVMHTAPTETAS